MKLLLAVIDGCKPSMLERAVQRGEAPVIAAVLERGSFVPELCAAFPSVTPVCATSIATGVLQDRHHIAAMNWWSRAERRYVEYGSSFEASRAVGVFRSLQDTVYNMNMAHLNRARRTVFEALMDNGIRTAGTTYLMYRGRKRHPIQPGGMYSRLARAGCGAARQFARNRRVGTAASPPLPTLQLSGYPVFPFHQELRCLPPVGTC